MNTRKMQLLFCIFIIMPVLSKGDRDNDELKYGEEPPKDSCEVPSWDKFNIEVTSIPEPKGPEGSICQANKGSVVVQVIKWTCREKFCCEQPCNCSLKLTQQTSMCQTGDPGSALETLVCLDLKHSLRNYKKVCCEGYTEDEHNVCVENDVEPPDPHVVGNDDSKGPNMLVYIIIPLLLIIVILLCVIVAILLYKRRKRRWESEKVIFTTSAYENDTYSDPHTGATGPIMGGDLRLKPAMEKGEIALRVDNIQVNPLYERGKEIAEYQDVPFYLTKNKTDASEYLSVSPLASGLPSYEHSEKQNYLSSADYGNKTGYLGKLGPLMDRDEVNPYETLDNSHNEKLEGGIYHEVK